MLILILLSPMVSILVLRQPSEGCVVADSSGFSQIVHACFGERPTLLRPFEHSANHRLKEAREDHNDGLPI